MFFKYLTRITTIVSLSALAACSGSDASSGIDNEEAAMSSAQELVGGEAEEATRAEEDGFDVWEVEVAMDNGAELEVVLFADSGDLFEIKDVAGPFDYDHLKPLDGQLTYKEARDVAFDEIAGDQIAWEVKYKDGDYFYEFYIEEEGEQLWEIKLWAHNSEVFVVEAKAAID